MTGPAAPDFTAALPQVSGDLTLRGLHEAVEVVRDTWGVPHIRARGVEDAFFAMGYVQAQDRLWQMDAARRRAVGRYAEWAGPGAVAMDVLMRQIDVAGASRRDAQALSSTTAAMLESYAAGVNRFIADGPLPVEHRLLDAVPEPWEAWHSVAVMRQRGILMGSVWFKLWRAAAMRTVGPEHVHLLRYDDGGMDRFCLGGDAEGRRWQASLEALAPALEAVAALGPADATDGGSNNWALAGEHTASGLPLVAGDPHRMFEIPNMYAQMHVACDAFDALGLTVPGVPGFPHFGHNDRVAWCVTHAFADIHDLYVEEFDPAAPTRYRFADGWESADTRTETVAVRGAPDRTVTVTTTRHGPVIAGDPASGHAVTLRTVQTDAVDRSLDSLLPMLTAGSVAELYAASRGWGLIDHNLVAADTAGHIGNLIRAVVPERDRLNGWLPVPGWTGAHEWRSMIPPERMPQVIDPPDGRLATANNRIVPDDHPDYLCTDCHPSYRVNRIYERLQALTAATVDDMAAIHADTHSEPAREIGRRIAACVVRTEPAERWRALIAGWDGRMVAESAAATAYYTVRRAMTEILARRSGLAAAAADPLTQVGTGVPPLNQLWWTLPELLRRDDTALLGGADWDAVIAEALETAAVAGPPTPWGEAHRPRFAHPLAALFPEHASMLNPASDPIGGDGDCVCAVGSYFTLGLPASYGAVARYVFDVGDWDRSRWVVFHGASGHPGSPHYADQNQAWAACGLVPAPYSAAAVAAHAGERLLLRPA